eukprot:4101491-Pleurochrysis_carterae.AAC.2
MLVFPFSHLVLHLYAFLVAPMCADGGARWPCQHAPPNATVEFSIGSPHPTAPRPLGAHPRTSRPRKVDRGGWAPTAPRPRRLAQSHRKGRQPAIVLANGLPGSWVGRIRECKMIDVIHKTRCLGDAHQRSFKVHVHDC